LKVNLKDLKYKFNETLKIDFCEKIPDIDSDKVTGKIEVSLTPYGADVHGKVETKVKLQCDRCLEEFEYLLTADINEKFVQTPSVDIEKNSKEIELKEEDFVQVLNSEKEIDISDLVYQTLILNLPFKKLCSSDCKGIEAYIPTIEEDNIDPRLKIFKKLSDEK
jgi:uncharacterized protein